MMDIYRHAFREEASELLAELETSLLELEMRPADQEVIGEVFRALHTIKGSSAMFGFDDIAAFTHGLETIFDLVRNGEIPVTSELVGLTLLARDQIKTMLSASDAEKEAAESKTREIAVLLGRLALKKTTEESRLAGRSDSPGNEPMPEREATYRISFRPARETFQNGTNPIHLLNELSQLGECRAVARTGQIPPLAELDPSLCYLTWDVTLTTAWGINAVKDVFIFVVDDSELEIEVVNADGRENNGSGGETPGGRGRSVANDDAAIPGNPGSSLVMQRLKETGSERQSQESISSIRVPAVKLDHLVNLVGELVTVQARLSQTAAGRNDDEFNTLAEEIERLIGELRDNTLNIRMLPIGSTFSRFRRQVHDLAIELGKEVEITTDGAETELDKTVIEKLNDPLMHLIRNCIDHGIELPDVRESAGKPRRGTVHLSAVHSGEMVLITIRDDGAGLDRDAILAKAAEKGIIAVNAEMPDRDIFALIFASGFSTSEEITTVSGRGVGMDVVRKGVDSLRGSISISSRQGMGTAITLKIPLTLAIIESLLVRIGRECYVLPLAMVEECLELTRADTVKTHGRHLVNVRGQIIPYIRLRERFGIHDAVPEIEQVVVTEVEGRRVGLVVDHVIGEHQTVIKSLGRMFRDVAGMSGATILGDGTVALILDIPRLVHTEETTGNAA